MGINSENDWFWNGDDYGTEFKNELVIMKDRITVMIEDLKKYKKEIDNESNNSKLTENAIEVVDSMVRKLEHSRSNIELSISSIKYYSEG